MSYSFANILGSLSGSTSQSAPQAPANTSKSASSLARLPINATTNPSLKRKHEPSSNSLPMKTVQITPSTMPSSGKSAVAQQTKPSVAAGMSASTSVKPAGSTAPPPKGSYREILARAEAAKITGQAALQIKHKPVVKPPRSARPDDRRVVPNGINKPQKVVDRGQVKSRAQDSLPRRATGVSAIGTKVKRKPLELEYKGTMRGNSSVLPRKAGPLSAATASHSRRDSPSQRGPMHGVASRPKDRRSYDDPASDDLDDEDEDDFDDDDSDDMGGGGFDELMEEEEASLRLAKKEDEEARRQEDEHKRQKLARKKALEQLAASRRARP